MTIGWRWRWHMLKLFIEAEIIAWKAAWQVAYKSRWLR